MANRKWPTPSALGLAENFPNDAPVAAVPAGSKRNQMFARLIKIASQA
jgi:hypothetical protein